MIRAEISGGPAIYCGLIALLLGARLGAADKVAPLVIGETFTIESKILDETRRINVFFSPGYKDSADIRLPVLYMLDGGIFATYIAIDPSLWWNDKKLVREAGAMSQARLKLEKTLFIASSEEKGIAETAQALADVLVKNAPSSLRWHYEKMPEEKHSTIFHPAALKAFRAVFKPAAGK